MNEKRFILSQQKYMVAMTPVMRKSVLVRIGEFFTEGFDAIARFVTKWTF